MRERDITRRCGAALGAVVLLVCLSILGSWWSSSLREGEGGETRPAARSPKAGPVPAAAGAREGKSVPAAAAKPGPAPAPARADDLERKAFQLEMENAKLRGRLDDMLNWILENVRGTFPLPEGQMAHLRLVPVDTNMAVSADLAEVLRLNDAEVDRMDAAFLDTKALLRDLEAENISVEKPTESQVVLNIPPYAEDGQMVREELLVELKKTLGAARFDRFLQVAGTGLEESFEYFGEVDRTLLFEAVRDAVSGDPQLFVRDERVVPNREDPLRQDIATSERIVTELPPEYDPYRSWLPEAVTRFSKSN